MLVLRYALDYDPTAIAELLELNVDAVYMRLSRARARFAEKAKLSGVGLES
jgi:DNA-directed RNA polymerase specialized sigma24 family protein